VYAAFILHINKQVSKWYEG